MTMQEARTEYTSFRETIASEHGRWIYDPTNWERLDYKCSVCEMNAHNTYDYCPNCGAKIDIKGIN